MGNKGKVETGVKAICTLKLSLIIAVAPTLSHNKMPFKKLI